MKVAVQLALPVIVLTGTVPQPEIVVPGSVNCTVPPSGTGETVAVNVTGCRTNAGFLDEVRDVVVLVAPGMFSGETKYVIDVLAVSESIDVAVTV